MGDCWKTSKSEKTQCQQLSGLFLPFQLTQLWVPAIAIIIIVGENNWLI